MLFVTLLTTLVGCKKPEVTNPIGQPKNEPTNTQNLFGSSKGTPVEVCDPIGEMQYLRRLRCEDGSIPMAERAGSVGSRTSTKGVSEESLYAQMNPDQPIPEGQSDYHIIDRYNVDCGGKKSVTVYMDMYH